MNAFEILMVAFALLNAVNQPGIDVKVREEAIAYAHHAIEIAMDELEDERDSAPEARKSSSVERASVDPSDASAVPEQVVEAKTEAPAPTCGIKVSAGRAVSCP